MTEIEVPQALLDKLDKTVLNLTPHRWLYSVVPASNTTGFNNFHIYLAGFCSNCKTAFSAIIPQGKHGEYRETTIPVPKHGCEGE